MAYIGRQLVRGQNRVLDDISGSFNGSTTAFNLTVSSSSSPPASVNQSPEFSGNGKKVCLFVCGLRSVYYQYRQYIDLVHMKRLSHAENTFWILGHFQ